jgi:hypothetical protein
MTIDKKIIVGGLVITIVALGIVLFYFTQQNSQSIKGGVYLNFSNGTVSQVYLVNSTLRYGVYERDYLSTPVRNITVFKGDPCVIITGTIRNEYDKNYYIWMSAQLYNESDEKVGVVTRLSSPWQRFSVIHVENASMGTFEIYVKYDKKDVKSYDVFLSSTPSVDPPY